ncbi:MAG: sigma-54 dependent transcriptional regulator [Deltaproteobacteria bacterium]|nr:sigma-54 dependent transcriptional regulator [Deltaproteobacteria bacterium]MCL5278205.1 sigma-54 dependent transcriptional regulator [Deltaproteobacteria bacterium]
MSDQTKILVVDDEENIRFAVSNILTTNGYAVVSVSNGEDAFLELKKLSYDFVICDVRMPGMDGMELLRTLQHNRMETTVIMMSAYGNIDSAIEAIKAGAYDYIPKPFKPDELVLTVKKAEERLKLYRENLVLKKAIAHDYDFNSIIGKSEKILGVLNEIRRVSNYKTTVLITGESGTGKDLVAKAIHYNSDRKDRPFISINCGAIPESLLESELFGYAKGAFTGAYAAKQGLFETADTGTMFLDEIGDMPFNLQVKLLRAIEESRISRIGDIRSTAVDIRLIAATSKVLPEEVKKGTFRDDLFYRLNVFNIKLPPLRERREDIPLLSVHFMKKNAVNLAKPIKGFEDGVMDMFMGYPWYGNIRELENVIERACIMTEGELITAESIPDSIKTKKESGSPAAEGLSIRRAQAGLEAELIKKALQETGGNKTRASQILEISLRALMYKLKEYGIE